MLSVQDFLGDQTIYAAPSTGAPLVSVILPTYSRRKLLERAMHTVLSQTFADFEFLVIDDGSSDGSSDLIEDLRSQDRRILHVRHAQNCGLPALRVNEGIELARGKYLAFQFDDDVWKENALADLVAEAERQPEPSVIIGRSLFYTHVGNNYQPAVNVNLVSLYADNRFANNSVLFPRSLVNTYGMYDPHIGMRRLCDWDLWLRMIKHVPFITLEKVTSEVFESNVGAIGVTVPWDMPLFRFINSIPRDQLLTPALWRTYGLDALKIGDAEFQGDIRRRVYEEQIVPYYFKMRHFFPGLGGFSAALPAALMQHVLFTKQSYDVCNEVTLNHYDPLTTQRQSYKSFYQTLDEVSPDWVKDANMLMLVRTVEAKAVTLAKQALEADHPLGLYLDDDLFTFHEFGPQFDYLAPGTAYYQNLARLSATVDGVLVTNDYIGDSVRAHTPRVIPHNNCVRSDQLPESLHPLGAAQLRIGYVGSGYRIEEFRQIWDALLRISKKYGDRLVFEFWGLDVSSLPPLACEVVYRPFTFSYPYYLSSLQQAGFDILLIPMLDSPAPRLGKSLIKFYEVAVAGALGIFSQVPQYARLEAGLTCLKADNTADCWYQALESAIEMPAAEFDLLRRRCLENVREEFTAEGQIDLHEAALRAIKFHSQTRSKRYPDGSPRIMYVLHSVYFGGAELQLWRRLRLIRKYGIQPIVVIPSFFKDTEAGLFLQDMLAKEGIQLEAVEYACFTEPRSPSEYTSPLEREQIRNLLERCSPVLVHTVTFIPSFGQICQEMNIPHVATFYAVQDDFAWMNDQPGFKHCEVVQSDCLRYATRWSKLLGNTPKFCARDMAPDSLFEVGQRKYLLSLGQTPGQQQTQIPAERRLRMLVTGTFQERKQQLETIEALGRLKKEGFENFEASFYGYTRFFPNYVEKCHQAIRAWGLEKQVVIQDFTENLDALLASADMLLSLSTYESFPGSIKDAMAACVLIVATPVGGISELIVDQISGILCKGTGVDQLMDGIRRALLLSPQKSSQIAEHARKIARLELHPYRAANDLFRMYTTALDVAQKNRGIAKNSVADHLFAPILVQQEAPKTVSHRANIKSPTRPPSSTMPIGAGLVYQLSSEKANLAGLDVFIGTHMRQPSGQLVMKIFSAKGNLLRSVSVELAQARDNDWLELRFQPIANSSGHQFRLEFRLENPTPGSKVSFYQNAPLLPRTLYLSRRVLQTLGFKLVGQQLYCREWYEKGS